MDAHTNTLKGTQYKTAHALTATGFTVKDKFFLHAAS